MKTVCIFDIDSTLADNDHRANLLEKKCAVCLYAPMPQNGEACPVCSSASSVVTQDSWDNFLDPNRMAEDTPIPGSIEVLTKIRNLGGEIHFITGRNEENTGEVTKEWLRHNAGWQPDKEILVMRQPDEAGLPASVYKDRAFHRLKNELMNRSGMSYNNPGFFFIFFEDDPHVFNLYKQYGLVVQCPDAWDYLMPSGARGEEDAYAR